MVFCSDRLEKKRELKESHCEESSQVCLSDQFISFEFYPAVVNMSSTNFLIQLLEKTSDWDKDERYMATNDLCNELSKDLKIDETMERRICAAVLKQLDDQSNDVQSVAVKCLAIILKKVHQTQIGEICDKLCNLILDGKDALRDIYSIGLKTLIADVPDEMGQLVSER